MPHKLSTLALLTALGMTPLASLSASAQSTDQAEPTPPARTLEGPPRTARAADPDAPPVIERQGDAQPFAQPSLVGYDFRTVFDRMDTSVSGLRREMGSSFQVFTETIDEAEALLDEGKTEQAVQKCVTAINGVLKVRDDVLTPMWEAQSYLQGQIGYVRTRLGHALEAGDALPQGEGLDRQSETLLNNLATSIRDERDPVRRQRLVMHYTTLRDIAKVRAMAKQLSPNQRKLWANVLRVLDEVSLSHQQVILSTELLFVQFEVTSQRLGDNLTLMETINGARDLLGMVNSAGSGEGALAAFAQDMQGLQTKLGDFNATIESTIGDQMGELDDALDQVDAQTRRPVVQPGETADLDDELARRIGNLDGEQTP